MVARGRMVQREASAEQCHAPLIASRCPCSTFGCWNSSTWNNNSCRPTPWCDAAAHGETRRELAAVDRPAIVTMLMRPPDGVNGRATRCHDLCLELQFSMLLRLLRSIRSVGSQLPVYTVRDAHPRAVEPAWEEQLRYLGARPLHLPCHYTVPSWASAYHATHFATIALLCLTQFSKVLYMDNDMFLLENVDHLVRYDTPAPAFVYSPNAKGINGGLMVLQPNRTLFEHAVRLLAIRRPKYGNGGNQEFWPLLFPTFFELPVKYNARGSATTRPHDHYREYAYVNVTRPTCVDAVAFRAKWAGSPGLLSLLQPQRMKIGSGVAVLHTHHTASHHGPDRVLYNCSRLAPTTRGRRLAEAASIAALGAFVHIPKTGGTSILAWGARHGQHYGREADWHHSRWRNRSWARPPCSPWHVPPQYDARVSHDTPMFTVIRDPFDRAVSQARHSLALRARHARAHQHPIGCNATLINAIIIEGLRRAASNPWHEDCHWLPQSEYFKDGNGERMSRIVVLRTESLEADVRRLTHTELDEHRYGGTVQERYPHTEKCDLAVLDRRTRAELWRFYADDAQLYHVDGSR